MSLFDDPYILMNASPAQLDYLERLIETTREAQSFSIGPYDIASFSMSGTRMRDGSIVVLDSNKTIADWPAAISFIGNTYTLENIVKGKDGFEEAQYA